MFYIPIVDKLLAIFLFNVVFSHFPNNNFEIFISDTTNLLKPTSYVRRMYGIDFFSKFYTY